MLPEGNQINKNNQATKQIMIGSDNQMKRSFKEKLSVKIIRSSSV